MAIRFVRSPRELGKFPKINIRSRKLQLKGLDEKPILPLAGMNQPETRIDYALNDLKVRHTAQLGFYGNTILGGARADFDLPDYGIVMNFQGVFHGTTEGRARDVIVNLSYTTSGRRLVFIYERDLKRLKPRILEIIGRPIYGATL